LLNPDRSKISKRTGAVYIGEFRDMGYLPEAMVNHLALSGWNPGTEQEIFDLEALLAAFSLDRCGKANAIFDRPKLLWLNGHYIRHISVEDLTRRVTPFLVDDGLLASESLGPAEHARLQQIISLEQERLKTLADTPQTLRFFFRDPDPGTCVELLRKNRFARRHALTELRAAFERSLDALRDVAQWSVPVLESTLDEQSSCTGWKRAELLMPIRIAISGRAATPPLFETMECVGQVATIRRLETIIAVLPPE
jgi:glutamyl/glutaminyl-tRNA synthetase